MTIQRYKTSMSLADQRRDYHVGTLDRAGMSTDPLAQFQRWYDEASRPAGGRFRRFGIALYKAFQELRGKPPLEPNAMVVATVDGEGRPSARTVLLKGITREGFTFFTNYGSRKGRELAKNPNAALTFYWPELERQVCIAGTVSQVSREESEDYFQSRPRSSQIGAWASPQSAILSSRKELQDSAREMEHQYAGKPVPLPPFWGGYLLQPNRIEFWQGRASRLHDRFEFNRNADQSWSLTRLSP
jgi:pyridoxamine 5'-phosphate oxidase